MEDDRLFCSQFYFLFYYIEPFKDNAIESELYNQYPDVNEIAERRVYKHS